jgi:hypothetical protein
MGLGGLLKSKKGPSPDEMRAAEEKAARAERDKAAMARAGEETNALGKMQEASAKRQAFAAISDDEEQRKKYLAGI